MRPIYGERSLQVIVILVILLAVLHLKVLETLVGYIHGLRKQISSRTDGRAVKALA
jgi:hypothetical protein